MSQGQVCICQDLKQLTDTPFPKSVGSTNQRDLKVFQEDFQKPNKKYQEQLVTNSQDSESTA